MLGRAGQAGRSARLGARAGPVRRRRPQLPARVRAHHPGPGAPGPVRRASGDERSLHEATRPPGAPPARGRGRRRGRAASSRSWCCRRSPTRRAATSRRRSRRCERALTLAEPEGYVRIFVDEGPPMAALLRGGRETTGSRRDYVRRLLAAVRRDRATARPSQQAPGRAAERTRAGRAPAARHRPGRPGHRPRARGVAEHRADPHQEHLRQARREQPPGSGPPGRGARPAVARPAVATRPPRRRSPHTW